MRVALVCLAKRVKQFLCDFFFFPPLQSDPRPALVCPQLTSLSLSEEQLEEDEEEQQEEEEEDDDELESCQDRKRSV